MTVKCPRCGKPTDFTPENEYRPFCSERCQTLDLGAWASEDYRVSEPVNKNSDDDERPATDFHSEDSEN